MPKNAAPPSIGSPGLDSRVRDGVSVRVRFASHAQIRLVKAAAARRGLGYNKYVQAVLQAVSERVMAAPETSSLAMLAAAEAPSDRVS